MSIALRYESSDGRPLRNVQFAIPVHGKFDERLFHLSTNVTGAELGEIPARGVVVCRIARLPLQPGTYSFNVFSKVNEDVADWVQNAGVFSVEADDFFGTGRLPPANQGAFLVPHEWDISPE
jgi:lipopolysaccharide transport system ATP-binding protein